MKVRLGDKVKDAISGFTGIVTGRAEYITGCTRLLVEAKSGKDGTSKEAWIDEVRLSVVTHGAYSPKAEEVQVRPAGPRDNPSRQTPR